MPRQVANSHHIFVVDGFTASLTGLGQTTLSCHLEYALKSSDTPQIFRFSVYPAFLQGNLPEKITLSPVIILSPVQVCFNQVKGAAV